MTESTNRESILRSNDIAFPRGGSTGLTPLEVKEISNEATKDVLFETAALGTKRKATTSTSQAKKKIKNGRRGGKTDSTTTEVTEEKESVKIENFNFKNLIPGTKVLGEISKISKLAITVSIGDNLFGHLPITSISEDITSRVEKYAEHEQQSDDEIAYENEDEDKEILTGTLKTSSAEFPDLQTIFQIGQWINAQIIENSSKKGKKIELSIEPSVVNKELEDDDLITGNLIQGAVISKEDHGIILDIGKPGLTGFISNKDLKDSKYNVDEFQVGQVLLSSISSKSARNLSLKPLEKHSKSSTISTITSVDAIQPGVMVDALVTDVTKNGIVTRVFGLVDGTINLTHLNDFEVKTLQHKYTVGNNVKARVIAVLPKAGTKKLILSQLPHIMNFQKFSELKESALEAYPMGHKFDEVKVKGMDPNYIYVDLGGSLRGQVHLSNLDPSKSIEIDYTAGSTHEARLIDYDAFDNVFILSFDPKVIEAKYLNFHDIQDGAYVNIEIVQVLPESKGIKVKVLDKFDGFVPPLHMSDIKLIYPERKFRVGTKVKARVLKKEKNRLLITLKKALVNIEDEFVLNSFENATPDLRTAATVEKFVHGGVIVSFFGYLGAFLPKNEISETFVDDPKDYLRIGQSVNVRVTTINKEDKKLVVSLRQSSSLTGTQKDSLGDLVPGKSVVPAIMVEKKKDSVIIELADSGLRGVIFNGHLSDGNYEQNRALAKRLQVGETLDVLVLEKDLKARSVIASRKNSLIEASKRGEVPASFKDIEIDERMIYGYVKSVTNMGLFISFGGKLTGLALAKYVTDDKNGDLSKKFYKYQSIACRVIRIDEENKRFLLSLKDINPSEGVSQSEAVINPVDSTKKHVGEYKPGVVTEAIIKSIKGTQLNVEMADNLQGRIDITQCFNSWNEIKDKRQPLSQFHKGEKVKVKIIGYHDAKNHKFLPITHKRSNKNIILELSMVKKVVSNSSTTLDISSIVEGSKQLAFVNNIAKGYVWVSIAPTVKGRISFMELTDDTSIFEDLETKLPIGSAFQASVKEIDHEHNIVILNARKDAVSSIDDVKVGDKYPARILKVKETFVLVELGENVTASAYITDALDDYTEKLESVFSSNDFTSATVLNVDKEAKKMAVSLRTESASDKLINSFADLKIGDVVRGFIKNIANNGIHVSLGRTVSAYVRVSDLSDSFLKDWKRYFKLHQSIVGKISACEKEGQVRMTLKESEVNGELKTFKKFEDLEVGEIFEGSVKTVTEFGVFVKLDGTFNVSGLCHHSEISDNVVENITQLFGEGDRVKVKVLKIDSEKKQLSLGMKASYFTEDIEMEDAEDEDADINSEHSSADETEESDDMEEDGDDEIIDVKEGSDSSDEESDDEEERSEKSAGLSTGGFDWTASILDQADNGESSSDDEDFTEKKKKRSKSKKYTEDKTGDINTRAPQSTGDFERLIIGNPNSSILWMNYMSFQLQLSELDKAREIGERALKIINYKDEHEKLNIWIALLNLENSFGSEETLEETFKRSCQFMDSLTMHQKLASIYEMSENFEKLDSHYKNMFKKFGSSNVQLWVNYASNLLDRNLNDQCHEILARALQVLSKRDHVEIVKKFAQLEFEKGEIEQGRSLFEGLINDAPKKIDLWNVYIDKEIKFGKDKSKVEDLFERALGRKLSKKQAKFFFNKWVVFENDNGDEKGAIRVKAKAAEYVESLSNA
ncbi:rRNA biogenesis protein rrp5 [Yamadazyma tenuis]|uniref:rRNA biogenesis protein rrp5 n=1 Tax=Candida tenuis TaxID=2315449 RepID=UPI0027A79D64|nr:rRNA biogenesis protein rrp5 [Yamadazyma tenuis]